MQCNFSGTKEHVSMETSTHGGRERGRREREQQRKERLLWQRRSSLQNPTQLLTGVIVCLFVCFNWFPLGDLIGKKVKGCHLGWTTTDPEKSSHTFWTKSPCRQWLCSCECCEFTALANAWMLSTLDKHWIIPKSLVVSWWVKKVKLVCCFRECNKGIYFSLSS